MRSAKEYLLWLVLLCGCSGGVAPAAGPAGARPSVHPTKASPPGGAEPGPATGATGSADASSSSKKLKADATLQTPSGGTLTGVKGWLLTERTDGLLLQDPEREMVLALLESRETDARRAVKAAWMAIDPKFSRPALQQQSLPPRDGWDAIHKVDYELTTREGHVVFALARRKSGIWYVALVDGTKQAIERRSGQLRTSLNSLRAPGVEEESFGGRQAHILDKGRLQTLGAFIEKGRKLLGIPGVAVSVVQGGRVVFEMGFGVRELGKRAPVTPDTLFLIGSNTKSMTSLLMAMLVDQGKLTWETKVVQLMPGFALGDAEATRKLTVKHTVCACTGLPRQDMEFLFEYRGATPEQRLKELATMRPTTGFGEAFQYSNPLVSAGGYLAGRVLFPERPLGAAYDAAMDAMVFRRLGMRSTTCDFKRALRTDHATPHGMGWELTNVPLPITDEGWLPSVRPAGGAWSNLHDMSRYVLVHLLKGRTPEGKRVVSEKNLLKRYEPQVRVGDRMSYGLALMVEKKNGIDMVSHGGGTAGFITQMLWLPEHAVGAVILTNSNGSSPLVASVGRKLLELLFDGRDEARENLEVRWKRYQEIVAKERSKINFAPGKEWLSRFKGDFTNPSLGKISIRLEGEKALFDVGEWKSRLGQKREVDGTLKLVLLDPPWNDMDLLPEEKQGKMTLLLETAQQKYLFEPAPGSR